MRAVSLSDPTPRILPSILSADFSRLFEDCRDVLRELPAPILHIDVMDGHFVPNISFGAPVFRWLRPLMPETFLDVHLMIDEPLRYAADMVHAGADNITFHIESPEVRDDPVRAARTIRELGVGVGVTLKPATPVETLQPVLELVDLVLIMSVEPGFRGQKFMPEQLNKARWLRDRLRPDQRIEIDGGIDTTTIGQARSAGVEWFVAGNAVFAAKDRAVAVGQMLEAMGPSVGQRTSAVHHE
jgi:ribulose-phosphate 3-epimerase